MLTRLASITIVAVALTAAPAAADAPFRIGVLLGLTGPGKPYSEEGLRGIEIAVEGINADGGLLGRHPVEVVVRNTRTNPDVARALARDLVEKERVQAVIGTYSSAAAIAIKPILREARVLHIATISNAEDLTRLDPSPYTFSVVPNTYMMAKAVALATARLAAERGWRRYATIASDYAWGRGNQAAQTELLRTLVPELQLVASFWPPLGEVSFNSYVVAIRNAVPDFLLASIAGTDNETWRATVRNYRLDRDVEQPFALVSVVELMRERKWLNRGSWVRTRAPFFAHPDEPMMRDLVEAYRHRHGVPPSDWAVMSYDGVHALRQAAEAATSIEPEAMRLALTGSTIATSRGRLAFRTIDNQLAAPAYVGRIADDSGYDFPLLAPLVRFPAEDIWRPEAEIRAARGQ